MEGKILIVDDDLDTLQLVGTMLERQGLNIIAASNGEQAVEKAKSEIPDLIILDVMMPGMDGYEVTRLLRSDNSTAFIPIILFTAKAQVDDKIEGFESGADDYLTKPTHPAELIARVRTILTRPKSSALAMPNDDEKVKTGNIYGIIAPKGGLGVSTLALNFSVSLQQQTREFVALGELRPGQGSIGLMLGYPNSESLNNLLTMEANNIRIQDVENALVTHGSGIQLLLSSHVPLDAEYMSRVAQMSAVVNNLGRVSPNIVLDLGAGLPTSISEVVNQCDVILLVIEPVPITMIQAKVMVENLESRGVMRHQIKPVLISRTRLEITLAHDQIQKELDLTLAGVITPAPELAYQATILHQPMIIQQPESVTYSQIKRLTSTILSEPIPNK